AAQQRIASYSQVPVIPPAALTPGPVQVAKPTVLSQEIDKRTKELYGIPSDVDAQGNPVYMRENQTPAPEPPPRPALEGIYPEAVVKFQPSELEQAKRRGEAPTGTLVRPEIGTTATAESPLMVRNKAVDELNNSPLLDKMRKGAEELDKLKAGGFATQ